MFKIKICGITSPEDALLAAEAGADAIGLNFYEQSPRYVTPERGCKISIALHQRYADFLEKKPKIFGVFVTGAIAGESDVLEAKAIQLWKVALFGGTKGYQLHGDEPPELIPELNRVSDQHGRLLFADPTFPIIRAFRCREPNLRQASEYVRRCAELGNEIKNSEDSKLANYRVLPDAILLDAYQPGTYGGTGQVVDWNVVRNERDLLMGLPVILAGGLTPENVAEAIATARPDAVDVASGVESSPGKKDPDKVRRFIAEARRAFAELEKSRPAT